MREYDCVSQPQRSKMHHTSYVGTWARLEPKYIQCLVIQASLMAKTGPLGT
jgi:hypothetical protein